MRDWYTRHRRLAILLWNLCGGLIGIALMLGLYDRTGGRHFFLLSFLVYFFYVAWFYLGRRIFVKAGNRRQQEALSALYNDCDPEPFLAIAEEDLARLANAPEDNPYRIACSLNKVTALFSLGRFSAAIDALPPVPKDPVTALILLINTANIHLAMNHPDEAVRLWEEAKGRFAGLDPSLPMYPACREALDSFTTAYRIHKGDTEGLSDVLKGDLARAENEYHRVGVHFQLGKLYLREDDPAAAKPHLEYVVEHGNKLYQVDLARDYLDQIAVC